MISKPRCYRATLINDQVRIKCIVVDLLADHRYKAFIMPEDFTDSMKAQLPDDSLFAICYCDAKDIELGETVEFDVKNDGEYIYDEDDFQWQVRKPQAFKRKTVITIDGVSRSFLEIELL